MDEERRREARYGARLPLTLTRGKQSLRLLTEDVSFRGVFLRMDAPPALRQLVQLQVTLPEGASLRAHAMVVYRIEPGGPQTPGAGVQFYGFEGRERAQWEAFVARVRDEAIVLTPSQSLDPVRRRFERHIVRFAVRLSTVDELATLWSRDLSQGGMALETDLDLPIGSEVGVGLVHPVSGELFELDGIVRRKIVRADGAGLAIEFVGLDEARRAQMERFIG
jgi:hypothetical protein